MRRLIAAAVVLLGSNGAAWAGATLIDAIKAGDRDAALTLVKQSDVNAAEVDGTTALHWAVHQEDADLVKRLIRAGADVTVANNYGASAMSEAATVGNAAIIAMLLKAGADVESPNAEGQTALMAVARTGRVDAARLLLDAGADVNATEQWGGQSALMWAAAQSQPAMVSVLVAHGADVDARGKVQDWQRRVTAEPRIKDMNVGGFTALLYAAREGCVECATHLLTGGADINRADPSGISPLVMALLNSHFEFAASLVQAGANPNQWDWWGRTPLYTAIDLNMVPSGGRADLPTNDAMTGVQVAELLLKAGANPNLRLKSEPPLRNAVFDRGGDSAVLTTGATPLLRAAKAGDTPAVKLLLEHGAKVALANLSGITPVMVAAGVGNGDNPTRGRYKTQAESIETLKVLLAAGGNINAHGPGGQTALHGAARKGWNDVVQFLADNGSDLEALDVIGLTAREHATGRSLQAAAQLGPSPPSEAHADTVALLDGLMAQARAKQQASR